MVACEKCWAAAHTYSRNLGGSQADHYRTLMAESGPKSASTHRIRDHDAQEDDSTNA